MKLGTVNSHDVVSHCNMDRDSLAQKCYRAGQGVVHDKLLQKGFSLSVSGGSSAHPHPPARFAVPTARGKTSLNARDW